MIELVVKYITRAIKTIFRMFKKVKYEHNEERN